ncbi:hypothetical protein IMCC26207_110168 [Actinobacteria bacterium IMCC26207]|nr:hypothetical protein IMCC26207_110168 [Actinobacteria bacterium IMCC26207]
MTLELFSDDGTSLSAAFEIDRSSIEVILHSRSGSNPPLNPDYFSALELLLERLQQYGAVIEDILVDSKVALKLPIEARRLRLDYPVYLATHTDIPSLRKEICAAQRTVAQRPGAKGGNNHKRIRLRVRLPSDLNDQWLRGTAPPDPPAAQSNPRSSTT